MKRGLYVAEEARCKSNAAVQREIYKLVVRWMPRYKTKWGSRLGELYLNGYHDAKLKEERDDVEAQRDSFSGKRQVTAGCAVYSAGTSAAQQFLVTRQTTSPRSPITLLRVGNTPSSPKSMSSRLRCCR